MKSGRHDGHPGGTGQGDLTKGTGRGTPGRVALCVRQHRVRRLCLAGSRGRRITQLAIYVDDIEATVAALRKRGVEFESFDIPGLKTTDGIAAVEGNYPSKGTAERAAWLLDSEGNLIAIGETLP